MTKYQEMKSLLMKINIMYDSYLKHTSDKTHNVYEVTRSIIDLIEETNNKKSVTKGKFKLLNGGNDAG